MASWDINLTKLKRELAILFDKEIDARVVVKDAGLDPAHIDFRGKSYTFWDTILEEAQKNGRTSVLAIVNSALEYYPQRQVLLEAKRYVCEQIQLSDGEDTRGLSPPPLKLVVDVNQLDEQSGSSDSGMKFQSDQVPGELIDSDNLEASIIPPDQSTDWDSNLNGLRDTLADLYFEKTEYTLFVEDIGILLDRSLLDGSPVNVWQSILKEVLKAGKIMQVIDKALERAPGNVELQVAECYRRNLEQQPPDMSHLSLSDNGLVSVCKDLGQLQRTTQFLMCWQQIIIRVNKRQPGAPLSFEQCNAIKVTLQVTQFSISGIEQSLIQHGHALLLSASEQNHLIDKLDSIAYELDGVMNNLSHLTHYLDSNSMRGLKLRQDIQMQLAKIIQYLEGGRSFMWMWQERLNEK